MTRLIQDQLFLKRLNNPDIRPAWYLFPIQFLARVMGHLVDLYRHEFNEVALQKYSGYLPFHYSSEGRGYFSYADKSDDEKIALFGEPNGRIQAFLHQYGHLLDYRNGQSFFDVGCGRGQNIKVLMAAFPDAQIDAIDLSSDALDVVRLAANSPALSLQVGDVSSPETFRDFETNSVDHVLMSHVFSIILGSGLTATREVRASLVAELVRIARKSVLIIDSPAIISPIDKFEIEQLHRGIFAEDITKYFAGINGSVALLKGGDSVGLLFHSAADHDDR